MIDPAKTILSFQAKWKVENKLLNTSEWEYTRITLDLRKVTCVYIYDEETYHEENLLKVYTEMDAIWIVYPYSDFVNAWRQAYNTNLVSA